MEASTHDMASHHWPLRKTPPELAKGGQGGGGHRKGGRQKRKSREVPKSLQPDTPHFISHNRRLKPARFLPAKDPSVVALTDCSWLLFSQDKNQEMQK